jgi:hypothetical protein
VIAIVLSALNFVTLRLLSGRVKEQVRDGVDGEGHE